MCFPPPQIQTDRLLLCFRIPSAYCGRETWSVFRVRLHFSNNSSSVLWKPGQGLSGNLGAFRKALIPLLPQELDKQNLQGICLSDIKLLPVLFSLLSRCVFLRSQKDDMHEESGTSLVPISSPPSLPSLAPPFSALGLCWISYFHLCRCWSWRETWFEQCNKIA